MAEGAGVRVHRAPERQKVARRVPRDAVAPHRVVLAIVEPRHPGQAGNFGEYVEQVVSVRIGWSGAKIKCLSIRGACVPVTRPGNQRFVDQAVVLGEAHEDATQQPRDRGLGQRTGAPDAERVADAFGLPRGPVLRLQGGFHLRNALGSLGESPVQAASTAGADRSEDSYGGSSKMDARTSWMGASSGRGQSPRRLRA